MNCDLESDPLLTFIEAGRHIRPDRPVHVSTFHRWMKGIRGRCLETTLVGGRRYVRLSQLNAFIDAIPAAAAAKSSPDRRRAIEAAECEADRAGIQ